MQNLLALSTFSNLQKLSVNVQQEDGIRTLAQAFSKLTQLSSLEVMLQIPTPTAAAACKTFLACLGHGEHSCSGVPCLGCSLSACKPCSLARSSPAWQAIGVSNGCNLTTAAAGLACMSSLLVLV